MKTVTFNTVISIFPRKQDKTIDWANETEIKKDITVTVAPGKLSLEALVKKEIRKAVKGQDAKNYYYTFSTECQTAGGSGNI